MQRSVSILSQKSSIEKEMMKFILLYFEHSLLLLLSIKIKQPPIVHLPNLKNYQSQDEEEFVHPKISKISSNQLIIKPYHL